MAFATNDERMGKRISDALGTATEQRAMRNYAGHRLAPWLAHVRVSRQETARPLLTPGEVMQLPPTDEVVLISGLAPIRARKLRYYQDANFNTRLCPAPDLAVGCYADRPQTRSNDWGSMARRPDARLVSGEEEGGRRTTAAFNSSGIPRSPSSRSHQTSRRGSWISSRQIRRPTTPAPTSVRWIGRAGSLPLCAGTR